MRRLSSTDPDMIEVIVKESVYKELDKQGYDLIEYTPKIEDGFGSYGSYRGSILHQTGLHGMVPCGTFEVLVKQSVHFPVAENAVVKITGDVINPKLALANMLTSVGII